MRWWSIAFLSVQVLGQLGKKKTKDECTVAIFGETELERLLKAGFIKPIEITDWVSPMLLVKKNNGKLRVCVNYKKLNACT